MSQSYDRNLPRVIGEQLLQRGWTIGTMESCTGGLIAKLLTDIGGSSSYVRGCIVTYATDLKVHFGVPIGTVEQYGVISSETALAMSSAIRDALNVDVGIGITGVAGPTEQEGKPLGQVHIGLSLPSYRDAREFHFDGDRSAVRETAAYAALHYLQEVLSQVMPI